MDYKTIEDMGLEKGDEIVLTLDRKPYSMILEPELTRYYVGMTPAPGSLDDRYAILEVSERHPDELGWKKKTEKWSPTSLAKVEKPL